MAGTITPDVVELVTVPDVELIDVGTWDTSTGEFTFTVEDLLAAIAAQDDPGYCTPIVKLGHVDPRFDGQPAIAAVKNLRLNTAKTTLLGDYEGMPRWLAESLPTAFPRRSIEGEFQLKTQTGTEHRFALTAVALLGVSEPAISTLADVKALMTGEGVNTPSADVAARRVTLTRNGQGVEIVTTATAVRASVSIDALREAFYATQPPESYTWVCEVYAGEDAFIIVETSNDDLYKIPWSETSGTVSFGAPEKVVVNYEPAPADDGAQSGLVLMSRDRFPATRKAVASVPLTEEQLTEIGLPADADAEAVTTRLIELGQLVVAERDAALEAATAPGGTPATEQLPDGVVPIDAGTLEELKVAAARGNQAFETLRKQDRDRFLGEAVKAGKFPASRIPHFAALYDADEDGTKETIAKLAANTIPIAPLGHDGEGVNSGDDALFAQVYPEMAAAGK